jgi:hypothetical protein
MPAFPFPVAIMPLDTTAGKKGWQERIIVGFEFFCGLADKYVCMGPARSVRPLEEVRGNLSAAEAKLGVLSIFPKPRKHGIICEYDASYGSSRKLLLSDISCHLVDT